VSAACEGSPAAGCALCCARGRGVSAAAVVCWSECRFAVCCAAAGL
jgi:hypothetical protein